MNDISNGKSSDYYSTRDDLQPFQLLDSINNETFLKFIINDRDQTEQ